jgi:hypothetical protein
MGRLAKQLIIGAIYLAVFGLVLYGAYDFLVPDPSCSDGRQNQGEEGVDCGPVCGVLCGAELRPITVSEPETFAAGEGIDVLVELENDNVTYGAARIDYRLVLTDASGEELVTRRGFTYANPLETRFLVVSFPGVATDDVADTAFSYEPDRIQWFVGQLPETQAIDFAVFDEDLSLENGFAEFAAVARNDSTFDFEEVDVSVVLLDASGRRVGIGATVLRTFPANGIRAFTIQWPFELSGEPIRAQAEISTNVFDNDNFIRTYGGQERFQGF